MIDQNITFRLAQENEFYTYEYDPFLEFGGNRKKVRLVGKNFWLLNSENQLEVYTLAEDTDTRILLQQIADEKIYLPKQLK